MGKVPGKIDNAGSYGVPGAYEFYWQCRSAKCRAVHWYCPESCRRCGKPLFRYNNPNFEGKRKK